MTDANKKSPLPVLAYVTVIIPLIIIFIQYQFDRAKEQNQVKTQNFTKVHAQMYKWFSTEFGTNDHKLIKDNLDTSLVPEFFFLATENERREYNQVSNGMLLLEEMNNIDIIMDSLKVLYNEESERLTRLVDDGIPTFSAVITAKSFKRIDNYNLQVQKKSLYILNLLDKTSDSSLINKEKIKAQMKEINDRIESNTSRIRTMFETEKRISKNTFYSFKDRCRSSILSLNDFDWTLYELQSDLGRLFSSSYEEIYNLNGIFVETLRKSIGYPS